MNKYLHLPIALITGLFLLGASPAIKAPAPVPSGSPTAKVTVTPVNVELVNFSSSEGQKRFERSDAKVDFFSIANQFESQSNGIVCGPATAAIILNAFRIEKLRAGEIKLPLDQRILSDADKKYMSVDMKPLFNRYTQNNVLEIPGVKTRAQIFGEPIAGAKDADWGMQLRQLEALFKAHGVSTTMRIVDDSMKEDGIRKEISQNLRQPKNFVVVNFAEKFLGQTGGGHISPLGAYDSQSDSVLLMDVNPNRADWVWVKIHDLVGAMRTMDTVENRGYLLLSE